MDNQEILNAEMNVELANRQLQKACEALMNIRKKVGTDDVGVIVRRDTEFGFEDGQYWLKVKFEKLKD